MQTFLPYPDFERSAAVLDDRRLGKQRVETLQILRAIHIPTYGWQHHPAVRMWRGYEQALVTYGVAMCREWVAREHPDTVEPQLLEHAHDGIVRTQPQLIEASMVPPWLGRRAFHRAHRSNLVRKDPDHYRRHFPRVADDLPYVWPVAR